MALVATRKKTLGNVLKYETASEHGYCREVVTVNTVGATELSVGSVVGKITASGKYVPRDPAAVDGSEVSAGMVTENKSVAAATDTEVAVIVRGPSILAEGGLVFDVAHDAGQTATAIAELNALNGVIVRTSV